MSRGTFQGNEAASPLPTIGAGLKRLFLEPTAEGSRQVEGARFVHVAVVPLFQGADGARVARLLAACLRRSVGQEREQMSSVELYEDGIGGLSGVRAAVVVLLVPAAADNALMRLNKASLEARGFGVVFCIVGGPWGHNWARHGGEGAALLPQGRGPSALLGSLGFPWCREVRAIRKVARMCIEAGGRSGT